MLPRLVIDGRRLTTRVGGPSVVLRGVNVSGLQHRRPAEDDAGGHWTAPGAVQWPWLRAAGIDPDLVSWIADQGATIVRVTLSQDWMLGRDHSRAGAPYLDDVD